jgi:hypothetical protein
MSQFNSSSTSMSSTLSPSASCPSMASFISDQYYSQDHHLPYPLGTGRPCAHTFPNMVFCTCDLRPLHGHLAPWCGSPLRSNLVLLAPLAHQATKYDGHLLLTGRTQPRRDGQFRAVVLPALCAEGCMDRHDRHRAWAGGTGARS